jgi:membrane-associated phospholipid phosphatase
MSSAEDSLVEVNNADLWSAAISNIMHPMLVSAVAFSLLIAASDNPLVQKVWLGIVAILFSSLIPIGFLYTYRDRLNTDERTERFLPLVAGIVCYFVGFLLLWFMHAPIVVQALMLCYATNTLIVLAITLWWKVSVHTTAISGPLVAIAYTFGSVAFPFYLLIPVVGTARVILKKHTVAQVIVGAIIGLVCTATQMHFVFQIVPNLNAL